MTQTFRRRGYETASAVRSSALDVSTRYTTLTMVPVLLVGTVRMLLLKPVLMIGILGVAAGLAVAVALSYLRLQSIVGRVTIQSDAAAVENAWSLLAKKKNNKRSWFRVIDLRGGANSFTATVGLESFEFRRADWPEFDELAKAFVNISAPEQDRAS